VCWTNDNNYILSGSEDSNIRVWKSDPSRKIGPKNDREERATNYRKKLIERYKYVKEIKQLQRGHMPKYIYNARKKKQIMNESKYRKRENMEANNPEDIMFEMTEKKQKVVKTLE